ncbi:MAG: undecaprenyl-diphosphate phosphatase [Candidatus Bruticola sp.]
MPDNYTCITEAVILGIIQGIAEFLPVSSSAHLMLLPKLANFPYFGKTFDVILHGGTLLAVCFYKKEQIEKLFLSLKNYAAACVTARRLISWRECSSNFKLVLILLVAAIPTAGLGFALENVMEKYFHGLLFTAATLSIFACLLDIADRRQGRIRELAELSLKDAFCLGVAQGLALFPGVSRSGIVLTAARFLGLSRQDSGTISLLTALPVVGGAFLVKVLRGFDALKVTDMSSLLTVASGFLASFSAGLIGIMLLEKIVAKHTLRPFAVYRIALAALLVGAVLFS